MKVVVVISYKIKRSLSATSRLTNYETRESMSEIKRIKMMEIVYRNIFLKVKKS